MTKVQKRRIRRMWKNFIKDLKLTLCLFVMGVVIPMAIFIPWVLGLI